MRSSPLEHSLEENKITCALDTLGKIVLQDKSYLQRNIRDKFIPPKEVDDQIDTLYEAVHGVYASRQWKTPQEDLFKENIEEISRFIRAFLDTTLTLEQLSLSLNAYYSQSGQGCPS